MIWIYISYSSFSVCTTISVLPECLYITRASYLMLLSFCYEKSGKAQLNKSNFQMSITLSVSFKWFGLLFQVASYLLSNWAASLLSLHPPAGPGASPLHLCVPISPGPGLGIRRSLIQTCLPWFPWYCSSVFYSTH